MIVDQLSRIGRYQGLHARFPQMFTALEGLSTASAEGRMEIDGDRLWASVARGVGRGREAARLECHRQYIDVQVVLAGTEMVGWRPLDDCRQVAQAYDPGQDIAFFGDRPEVWLKMGPGMFAIFFPEDAHAPLAGKGTVLKAVGKVAVG
jgi:YhcH/YjgK/YiaL family protein